jgi:hypothetical protein
LDDAHLDGAAREVGVGAGGRAHAAQTLARDEVEDGRDEQSGYENRRPVSGQRPPRAALVGRFHFRILVLAYQGMRLFSGNIGPGTTIVARFVIISSFLL